VRDLGNGRESAGNSSERKEGRKARASEAGPAGPQSLTRETTVLSFTQLCFFLYSYSFEGPKRIQIKEEPHLLPLHLLKERKEPGKKGRLKEVIFWGNAFFGDSSLDLFIYLFIYLFILLLLFWC